MKFDKQVAAEHFYRLALQHDISFMFHMEQSGLAWIDDRKIKVPRPYTITRFGVCLHEVKHVIQGHLNPRYLEELNCDLWAIQQMQALGFDTADFEEAARRYLVYNLAEAFNRGLNLGDYIPI